MVRKMKIFKIFFDILNHHIFDYYHANFRQNRRKNFFWLHSGTKMVRKSPKFFFSDFDEILRGNSQKYGNSKYQKKFKIFHFSDHFLTVCANAHCDEQNFLGKFFIFNKNDLVRIWDSSECAFKSWFLVVKLKMGVWQFWPQGGVTPKTDMPPTYQAQK